jgi:hypothetical protein
MRQKEYRARIDWILAKEQHTYGLLLELQDRLNAIRGELDQAANLTDSIPKISNIVAEPSRVHPIPRERWWNDEPKKPRLVDESESSWEQPIPQLDSTCR